ncbi:hypothetical protein AJ87_07435 [Rhizobium yanglingense]|nr:hypothetical protein AJ87_07435 [Rhizobium yanglingense]
MVLSTNGLILTFVSERSRPGDRQRYFFNASENVLVDNLDRDIAPPILRWRLWQTRDHFENQVRPLSS